MRMAAPALVTILALLWAGPTLHAGESRAFGIGAGIATGPDVSPYKPLFVEANLRLKFSPNLAIESEAGWYRQSQFGENLFTIGGSALVLLPAKLVEVWGGAGPAIHAYHISDDGYSASGSHLGLHLVGGLDLRASESVWLFGAARYELIFMRSDYTGKRWMLFVGARFTH